MSAGKFIAEWWHADGYFVSDWYDSRAEALLVAYAALDVDADGARVVYESPTGGPVTAHQLLPGPALRKTPWRGHGDGTPRY